MDSSAPLGLQPLWPDMTYYDHQLAGIAWMLDREVNGTECATPFGESTVFGGLQCDDMGLGKTIQTAATMLNNPVEKTLLLAPLAMLDTWIGVFERAGFAVYEARSGKWTVKATAAEGTAAVYVCGYERAVINPSLTAGGFDRIVLDEAHKIRNPDGETARSLRRIKAPIRWALTGTPIVNKRKDIVSLLAFVGVKCGALYKWQDEYEEILGELMIHRELDEVRDVVDTAPPEPTVREVLLDFETKAEQDFYRGIQGALGEKIAAFKRDLLTPQQKFLLLLRLRQISVHPQVYINAKRREDSGYDRDDWEGTPTKVNALKGLVEAGVLAGHRYLVFCQFMDEMTYIAEALEEEGVRVEKYHGGLNQMERAEALKAGADVLLVQIQAGGVGLNLQEYDRCVFMSPWWTAALMDQAVARTVRMGQKKKVEVIHLRLAEEETLNIDALMGQKAEEKRAILEDVLKMKCCVELEADAK